MTTPPKEPTMEERTHYKHLRVAIQSLAFQLAMSAHGRGPSAFDDERLAALEYICTLAPDDGPLRSASHPASTPFSQFIREASPEEKERVYTGVMERASAAQVASHPAGEKHYVCGTCGNSGVANYEFGTGALIPFDVRRLGERRPCPYCSNLRNPQAKM